MRFSGIIGDRGELIDAGDPQSGNWFGFRFVFVSCVRASGRGEAAWVCERAMFPNAGAQNGKMCSGGGSGGRLCLFVFVAMLMGFLIFSHGLLLCSWAF